MATEQDLIAKLQRIEALFAGAATPGEREAAAQARERIQNRLREQQQAEPPVEFAFKLQDPWSHELFIALLRRYQICPYRYRGDGQNPTILPILEGTVWRGKLSREGGPGPARE